MPNFRLAVRGFANGRRMVGNGVVISQSPCWEGFLVRVSTKGDRNFPVWLGGSWLPITFYCNQFEIVSNATTFGMCSGTDGMARMTRRDMRYRIKRAQGHAGRGEPGARAESGARLVGP